MKKLYDIMSLIFWLLYLGAVAFGPGIALILFFKDNYVNVVGCSMLCAGIFTMLHITYLYKHQFIFRKIEQHIKELREG